MVSHSALPFRKYHSHISGCHYSGSRLSDQLKCGMLLGSESCWHIQFYILYTPQIHERKTPVNGISFPVYMLQPCTNLREHSLLLNGLKVRKSMCTLPSHTPRRTNSRPLAPSCSCITARLGSIIPGTAKSSPDNFAYIQHYGRAS
jgi:hypothetical protein